MTITNVLARDIQKKIVGVLPIWSRDGATNLSLRNYQKTRWIFPFICTVFIAACAASSPPSAQLTPVETAQLLLGSCALALPATATDEEAIARVLQAEGDLVVKQEIDRLMQLWNYGATVVDAKNTATEPSDDQQWLDKDAIRHRYVRTVFPGAPAMAAPKDLQIAITGKTATITSTTQIGEEVSPGGDRWLMSKQGNCWAIDRLTYNLESK